MADAQSMGDDEVTRLLADDVQAGAAFGRRKEQAECVAAVRRMCARHRETGTWGDVTPKKMKAHGVTVQKQMFYVCKRVAKGMTSPETAPAPETAPPETAPAPGTSLETAPETSPAPAPAPVRPVPVRDATLTFWTVKSSALGPEGYDKVRKETSRFQVFSLKPKLAFAFAERDAPSLAVWPRPVVACRPQTLTWAKRDGLIWTAVDIPMMTRDAFCFCAEFMVRGAPGDGDVDVHSLDLEKCEAGMDRKGKKLFRHAHRMRQECPPLARREGRIGFFSPDGLYGREYDGTQGWDVFAGRRVRELLPEEVASWVAWRRGDTAECVPPGMTRYEQLERARCDFAERLNRACAVNDLLRDENRDLRVRLEKESQKVRRLEEEETPEHKEYRLAKRRRLDRIRANLRRKQ